MSTRSTLTLLIPEEVMNFGKDFKTVSEADLHTEMIEKHAVLQSANRIEELVSIFIHATKVRFPDETVAFSAKLSMEQMETGFWEMGLSS